MFLPGTHALLACLSAVMIWLPLAQRPAQVAPPKPDTLTLNVIRGEEAGGSMKLCVVATNLTPQDVVITGATVVHVTIGASGNASVLSKNPIGLPPFERVRVPQGKSLTFEVFSNVELAAFYKDGLQPTDLAEDQRTNARAGRLILEVQSIDGSGKKHESYFRVGTVTVVREGRMYVRPHIVIDRQSFDAFEVGTLRVLMQELMKKG